MKYAIIVSRNINPEQADTDNRIYDSSIPHGKGNDLETLVNTALLDGATLVGGIAMSSEFFSQAIFYPQHQSAPSG